MSINDSTEEIKKQNEGMKTRLWFKVLIFYMLKIISSLSYPFNHFKKVRRDCLI